MGKSKKRSSPKEERKKENSLSRTPPTVPTTPIPIVNAPTNRRTSELRDKLILVFIEIVILGSLSFLFAQKYSTLRDFSDIRFEARGSTNNQGSRSEVKMKYLIYRLGEQRVANITLNFGIPEEQRGDYEIREAFVKEYEKSIFDIFIEPSAGYQAKGSEGTPEEDDLDYSSANLYRFTFNEMSPAYTYVFIVVLKQKNSRSPHSSVTEAPGFIFKLMGEGLQTYDHHMEPIDYLRLYLTEILILTVFLLAILALLIWNIGNRILTKVKGA